MKLILAIIAIVAAGAIFFTVTEPAYNTVQAESAQIGQYSAALDKATQLQTLKQSLLSKYNAFDPNALDRLQKFLPDHVDNIALILDINSIASQYGMSLQNVDVSTPASTGSSSAQSTGATAPIGGSNQQYDSLTLHFTTQGTYANFLQFLGALQSSLRIVDISSLSIGAPSSGGQGLGSNSSSAASGATQYSYSITLRTYWLK